MRVLSVCGRQRGRRGEGAWLAPLPPPSVRCNLGKACVPPPGEGEGKGAGRSRHHRRCRSHTPACRRAAAASRLPPPIGSVTPGEPRASGGTWHGPRHSSEGAGKRRHAAGAGWRPGQSCRGAKAPPYRRLPRPRLQRATGASGHPAVAMGERLAAPAPSRCCRRPTRS